MGAPADVIKQFTEEQAVDDDFDVWPENWQALNLFLASESQWRYAPNGKATGLIYTGVYVVMQMRFGDKSVTDMQTAFEGLQIMESEVLRVWSEQ